MQKENPSHSRREFISLSGKVLASAALLTSSAGVLASHQEELNVGQIMDAFIKEVPGSPFEKTVDTLKSGDRNIKVKGIITTMFATIDVINKAIALNANFIIAHEPTFYNHADETAWLKNDDVFNYKMDLLKKHNIAVWRNHDYIHMHQPDGVRDYVVRRLGWTKQYDTESWVADIQSSSLQTLIMHAKKSLGIKQLRYIGDPRQVCKKILLMPGAAGGQRQITAIGSRKPDVLMCGEIQEWETAEYVRDARSKGDKLSLIVLGHIPSEEPGSAYMAEWVKQKFPAIPVKHVGAGSPFSFG
ncbi:Nif3-like dinuclear metal center hexameric protein [Terrimonas sp. NA20]|uniref:Nif3-like dinuclear metal center hexameric protein n=1 Tax=Terrimonas ginsenosidimutans TaxID=2908004 RepID=A0ABS9KKR6_9BACT|nr:Nif3-like dinuclear metal center hexameric protein [Terrimonas ginsenosidimutans]MCG2612927.1 Nif3-like dinuclear metal center hexameric protein [Terrimonas ginsenosidimutans]